MNFDQALELTTDYLRADIPVALWGDPGIGKSALAQLVAERFTLEFIDIRLGQHDPVDLNGFAHKDIEKGTFDYLPWARFPLENTPLPDSKKGWLIMLDEINTAPRQNLAASYKLILDRMVGMRKLNPRVRFMLGGNLVGQGLAGALPSPLVSRVAHINMDAQLTPTLRNILGQSLFTFLTSHPSFIYKGTQEPNTPFPTLRTWEMAHNFQKKNNKLPLEALVGIVGTEAAVSYMSFLQQESAMLDELNGVAPFTTERSQDLINYLSFDIVEFQKQLHRFVGEWQTLAKAAYDGIVNSTTP